MTFTMPFSKNETQHLIYLLNCEYKKKRELREKMLSNIYKSFKYPKVIHLEQELDHLKDELVANQLLVHKLDDHLTDLGRGRTLDLPEEIPEFSGENNPLNHFKKLTIVPDNETD
tara:strand:- start:5379 stop:5723 length:345 start_codon:yes stop_codon:yes gene_type:complete